VPADYQLVHQAAVAFFAFVIAALHCAAKAALPSGVAALSLNRSRSASKLPLNPGRLLGDLALIVVRQASNLVIYSLHS
jgi:hypothetical protein